MKGQGPRPIPRCQKNHIVSIARGTCGLLGPHVRCDELFLEGDLLEDVRGLVVGLKRLLLLLFRGLAAPRRLLLLDVATEAASLLHLESHIRLVVVVILRHHIARIKSTDLLLARLLLLSAIELVAR